MKNNLGTFKVFTDANAVISKKSSYLNQAFITLAVPPAQKTKKETELKVVKTAA